jgi:endonuclease/exonuclease/phosphatase family metal-dependent hydrolase
MKILNLNLWNYNNWEERKPLIADFIEKRNPDIITMQEVRDDLRFNPKGNNQAKQINNLLNYPYFKFIKTMDVNKVNNLDNPPCYEGLAVLSKHPIIKSQKFALKKHPEDKFTRAILWVKIKDLDLINVHYSPDDLFSKLHLEETLEFAKRNNIRPVIIGDFNIRHPNIVEEVIGTEYVSTRSLKKYISYPPAEYTLDYALVPKGIELKSFSCVGNNISDHKSLIIEI